MNLDTNFPAPLQVLMFLGSAMLAGVLMLVSIYGIIRRKSWLRWSLGALATGAVIYFGLVLILSGVSKEKTLAHGEEKYFCEIDCHLAYSIADMQSIAEGNTGKLLAVTVRTRFDEKTISPTRPRNASLTPNPRAVQLVDDAGNTFTAGLSSGTPLDRPLIPGESYLSTFVFKVPNTAQGLRLLITAPAGPVEFLIGNELSLGHKKTYMAL